MFRGGYQKNTKKITKKSTNKNRASTSSARSPRLSRDNLAIFIFSQTFSKAYSTF